MQHSSQFTSLAMPGIRNLSYADRLNANRKSTPMLKEQFSRLGGMYDPAQAIAQENLGFAANLGQPEPGLSLANTNIPGVDQMANFFNNIPKQIQNIGNQAARGFQQFQNADAPFKRKY